MSSAAIIAIAIGVAVVLAAIVFVTTARRSDVRGAGALSNETRRRDETARRARVATESEGATGRAEESRAGSAVAVLTAEEAERAGDQARHPTPVLAPPAAPVPWVPPDPEAIGVSRRQFFNRATVTLTSAGIGAFAAAGFVAFLWPTATGGFGQVVNVGKLDDIKEGAQANSGFFYAPRRARGSPSTRPTRCPRRRASTTPPPTSTCAPTASSPSTRSARTSVAACPTATRAVGSSARATGRSTTRSARRRAARRPRGMYALPHHRRRLTERQRRHQHADRRTAHRHQHHRPGGRGSPLHHRCR